MAYQVSVFISHSWWYSDHYNTLAEWIFQRPWNADGAPVHFVDHSVPKDDPIHYAPTDAQLQAAIFAKIMAANVVVIPTGMYANYSKWIGKEINGASTYRKPILAVNPWGQIRNSSVVAAAANDTVGWNANSVVNGVWKLYRGG